MSKDMEIQKESGVGNANAGFVVVEEEILSAAGAGVWIFFPRGADGISIILDSTGDGRIEATNASHANIVADTVPATEIVPWDHGDIGVATLSGYLLGANAFRQVNISGTTTMSAVGIN